MIVCAPSEDSDHPMHPFRLISSRCPPEDALDHWLPTECHVKTVQTARMRRLIDVRAPTCSLRGL